MDLSYALNKETLFVDSTLDIIHVFSIRGNLENVEEDFNNLELIAKDGECLNNIKDAKSLFYIIKENIYNHEEDSKTFNNLKEKLTIAYNIFLKKLTPRNYA